MGYQGRGISGQKVTAGLVSLKKRLFCFVDEEDKPENPDDEGNRNQGGGELRYRVWPLPCFHLHIIEQDAIGV